MSTFTLCLTHDVDRIRKTYQYISHFLKELKNKNYNQSFYHLRSIFHKNPYWNFDKIIALEREYDVRSTFFFLHETIPVNIFSPENWKLSIGYYKLYYYPITKIITYLDENGWEVGLHGSYNSYNNIELLINEKKLLETIVGHEICGIRQHYLNLEIPLTWNLQYKAGFLYDASYGARNEVKFPADRYHPFVHDESPMVILPLAIMDSYLFSIANDYETIWEKCLGIIDEAEINNAVLTVLWHQRVFNENEYPLHARIYRKIIEECINRNAQITLCKDVYSAFVKQEKNNAKEYMYCSS